MSNMPISKEIGDVMRDFCLNEDYKFYPDYSGRGMFGRKCIGIVHKDATAAVMMRLAVYVLDYFPYEPEKIADAFRHLETAAQDNMGLETITYWPNIDAENAASEK